MFRNNPQFPAALFGPTPTARNYPRDLGDLPLGLTVSQSKDNVKATIQRIPPSRLLLQKG